MPKSNTLSPGAIALLQQPFIAQFVTLMPDGAPQATPVWVDVEADGRHVLVNTAEGRIKAKNAGHDPRVALTVLDPGNPYRFVTLRGRIVERRHEGADEQIDALAKKYLGQEKYPMRQPGEQRVVLRIAPDHILEQGT
jgi:PPOX class probable F420-dependent enzyme